MAKERRLRPWCRPTPAATWRGATGTCGLRAMTLLAGAAGRSVALCPSVVHGLGDLAVGHVEHLSQREYCPLGRSQRLRDAQYGDRDVLRELDVLGDVRTGRQQLGRHSPTRS